VRVAQTSQQRDHKLLKLNYLSVSFSDQPLDFSPSGNILRGWQIASIRLITDFVILFLPEHPGPRPGPKFDGLIRRWVPYDLSLNRFQLLALQAGSAAHSVVSES
jgi:hypothetical protein